MNLHEFTAEPRGPCSFDTYRHHDTIETPIGSFTVELQVDDASQAPPDAQMLGALCEYVDAVANDNDTLIAAIFAAYREAASDKRWFSILELPDDLTINELPRLVHGGRVASERFADADLDTDVYHVAVHVQQDWDAEHGLHFVRENGEWLRTDC